MSVSYKDEERLVEAYGDQYEGCADWGWAESMEAEEALDELNKINNSDDNEED